MQQKPRSLSTSNSKNKKKPQNSPTEHKQQNNFLDKFNNNEESNRNTMRFQTMISQFLILNKMSTDTNLKPIKNKQKEHNMQLKYQMDKRNDVKLNYDIKEHRNVQIFYYI